MFIKKKVKRKKENLAFMTPCPFDPQRRYPLSTDPSISPLPHKELKSPFPQTFPSQSNPNKSLG